MSEEKNETQEMRIFGAGLLAGWLGPGILVEPLKAKPELALRLGGFVVRVRILSCHRDDSKGGH